VCYNWRLRVKSTKESYIGLILNLAYENDRNTKNNLNEKESPIVLN